MCGDSPGLCSPSGPWPDHRSNWNFRGWKMKVVSEVRWHWHPKMSLRLGSIYTISWGLCHLLSIHCKHHKNHAKSDTRSSWDDQVTATKVDKSGHQSVKLGRCLTPPNISTYLIHLHTSPYQHPYHNVHVASKRH